MNARSFSCNIFILSDLKLKHRPCGSTSWFISILSDWPFMDFLVLLCSKIDPFECPHAVLVPCSVNSSTNYKKLQSKQFCRAVSWRGELLFPCTPFFHFQELWPLFYLWVIKEPLDQSMCKLLFPLKWAPIEQSGGGGFQGPDEVMTEPMEIP